MPSPFALISSDGSEISRNLGNCIVVSCFWGENRRSTFDMILRAQFTWKTFSFFCPTICCKKYRILHIIQWSRIQFFICTPEVAFGYQWTSSNGFSLRLFLRFCDGGSKRNTYTVSYLSTFERFAIQANGCYPRNCQKLREKQSTHKLRTCQIESFEMFVSFFASQV